MSLAPGARLGPYEVVGPLGAGGMGEVYRAHDPRLRRDVAIKVLPTDVAGDSDRLRRFEQEARATAALNHPNILAVYDVGRLRVDAAPAGQGHLDGREQAQTFVVSELLDGQTLREVMASGPMPVRKVLDYAIQVTHGLAASHEKGIIHRDLKPENLFVTADERVKILDFGLAKVADTRHSGASTVLAAGTEPGMVLGTMGYMAPEQVRGVAVDHRADLFSFGAVLYEMLAGRRAFTGETVADTLTAILKEHTAPLEDSGRAIPPALARVVERCLEKAPSRRFQSASDLGFALQTLAVGSAATGSSLAPVDAAAAAAMASGDTLARAPTFRALTRWAAAGWILAVVAGLGLAAALWWRPAPPTPPFFTMDIAPPPGQSVGLTSALSPDGSHVVYEVEETAQRSRLWLRELTSGGARPLEGTDDGNRPFWSPDGRAIGFFANRRLLTLDLQTGRTRVICDADGVRVAGTWSPQNIILFSREADHALMRIDATRPGSAVAMDHARGVRPKFLPDGRHYLYTTAIQVSDGGVPGRTIRLGDLDSTETTEISGGRDAIYAAGHLLFVRNNSLVAQPFDATARALSGAPRVLIDDLGSYPGDTGSNFSVAGDRLLAYRRDAEVDRQLVWYARDGRRLGVVDEPGSWRNPELSPEDTYIAAQRNDRQGLREDVWLHDVTRRTSRPLLATSSVESAPVWSADGAHVIARSVELGGAPSSAGTGRLVQKSIETGEERVLVVFPPMNATFQGLTPDGRSAILFQLTGSNRDIVLVPLDNPASQTAFASTPFNETQPMMSPDGRWLAYVSNELGQRDVFIQAFPAGGRRLHVTEGTGGGVQPRWSRDGRELYFLTADGVLTVVTLTPAGETLRVSPARPLFRTTMDVQAGLGTRADYAVTRDGQRFVVAEPRAQEEGGVLTVLVNWMSGLAPPGSPER